jgi:hypothetical protein
LKNIEILTRATQILWPFLSFVTTVSPRLCMEDFVYRGHYRLATKNGRQIGPAAVAASMSRIAASRKS